MPKGEHPPEEEPWAAARREFAEETGLPVPDGEPVPLGTVRQSGGKEVTVWAVEGDLDAAAAVSNTFSLEWPRGLRHDAGVPRARPVRLGRRRHRARAAGRRPDRLPGPAGRAPRLAGRGLGDRSAARQPSYGRDRLAITAAAVTPSTVIANSASRTPAVALTAPMTRLPTGISPALVR